MTQPPKYPKGDLRRMLMVLAAIQPADGATLVNIAKKTGLDKKTVTNLLGQAVEQAGVQIEKVGAVYYLRHIGPVFKIDGAKLALQGALNAPIMK